MKDVKDKIMMAAVEYVSRSNRKKHPVGSFDSKGRFYIANSERCECCHNIRSPSKSYPYSEMVHARSAIHVSSMFGVDNYVSIVRKAAKIIEKDGLEAASDAVDKIVSSPAFKIKRLESDLDL